MPDNPSHVPTLIFSAVILIMKQVQQRKLLGMGAQGTQGMRTRGHQEQSRFSRNRSQYVHASRFGPPGRRAGPILMNPGYLRTVSCMGDSVGRCSPVAMLRLQNVAQKCPDHMPHVPCTGCLPGTTQRPTALAGGVLSASCLGLRVSTARPQEAMD